MAQLPNELVDIVAQTGSPQELLLLHLAWERPFCAIARDAKDGVSKLADTHLKAFPCVLCVPIEESQPSADVGPEDAADDGAESSATPRRPIENWVAYYKSLRHFEGKQEKSRRAEWAQRSEEVLSEHAARTDKQNWINQDCMGWNAWSDADDEVVMRERRERQYLALRRAVANCLQQDWIGRAETRLAVFDAALRVPNRYGESAMQRVAEALGIGVQTAFAHRTSAYLDLQRRLTEQCQQGAITSTELRSFGFGRTH